MKKTDFYFELPKELIAQTPLANRQKSKLLKLDKKTSEITHHTFEDITCFLKPGDVLVLNDTKVLPARIYGKKQTGAIVEFLLLKEKEKNKWECLVKTGKKAKVGDKLTFSETLQGIITDIVEEGNRIIEFYYKGIFLEELEKIGEMPLPHYIEEKLEDQDRYQTVYAKYVGSAAAPTAGLHFTDELIKKIKGMDVTVCYVTLHVGLGTFRPVKTDNISDHKMHSEYYEIPEETADIINKAKLENRRVIAVGTTSVRTLESSVIDEKVSILKDDTSIFIFPGYQFKIVDAIITNFHLPESTLMMLISAFTDRKTILNAYEQAIKEKYRFFSFGDSMIII